VILWIESPLKRIRQIIIRFRFELCIYTIKISKRKISIGSPKHYIYIILPAFDPSILTLVSDLRWHSDWLILFFFFILTNERLCATSRIYTFYYPQQNISAGFPVILDISDILARNCGRSRSEFKFACALTLS